MRMSDALWLMSANLHGGLLCGALSHIPFHMVQQRAAVALLL